MPSFLHISEFTTDIQHIQGKDNFVADSLSRTTIDSIQLGIDYAMMATDQAEDLRFNPTEPCHPVWYCRIFLLGHKVLRFYVTCLLDVPDLYVVPVAWRQRVFDLFHGLSHPSNRATRNLIASKFVWKGLQKQIGHWVRTCIPCQSSNIQTHIRAPLETFQVPNHRFDCIHVDLVGPLPPSNGFTYYLLTIVDQFLRWPEAIPLNDTTTTTCAQALMSQWISRFGIPLDMTSDRGSQFTSQLWSSIAQLLGIQLHHTIAYHPQSNDLVERFHRHLKSSLRARLTGPNWTTDLPWVLLGIRTLKEDLGCSSAELVYGAPITVPGEFFHTHNSQRDHQSQLQQLRKQVCDFVPVPTSQHAHGVVPSSQPSSLKQTKFVFIRCDSH